jgi:hypothetical protein
MTAAPMDTDRNKPTGNCTTHSLVRTSPKGAGMKFLGRCIKCGMVGLPMVAALEPCGNYRRMTDDDALLAVISGERDVPRLVAASNPEIFMGDNNEPDGMVAYALAIANPSRDDPSWPLPSFDARDWAKAFCKINPDMDESTMVAWFANALMRGYDEHARLNAGETP